MPLLSIKNLSIEFPGRYETDYAVEDVSFDLEPGEILGLVGESGAGKSTIGNGIVQLLSPPGRVSSGEIYLNDSKISDFNEQQILKVRGSRVGFIFQDPMTSLNPLFTVENQMVETILTNLDIDDTDEAEKIAVDLLRQVGIPDPEVRIKQFPHQFSGGMRQRVVIAIALAGEPELLIADEPTTALDVSVQDQILSLIRKTLSRAPGRLPAGHARHGRHRQCHRPGCGHVPRQAGRTRHHPANSDRAEARLHQEPDQRGAALQHQDRSLPAGGIHRDHRQGTQADRRIDALARPEHETQRRRKPARNRKLNLSFITQDAYFRAQSQVPAGHATSTCKSNRAKLLAWSVKAARVNRRLRAWSPDCSNRNSGSIRFDGVELINNPDREAVQQARLQMQMVFQNPYSSLNGRMKVNDIIAEPIRFHRLTPPDQVEGIVGDLLDHVGLGRKMGRRYPHEFSGGQRQRISIARALACRPRLLICDEPTSALDVSVQAQILNLLKDLQDELGLTMLFISHDLPVIRQMCDRVAIMRHGRILETADAETFFENPQNEYSIELLSLMPRFDRILENDAAERA